MSTDERLLKAILFELRAIRAKLDGTERPKGGTEYSVTSLRDGVGVEDIPSQIERAVVEAGVNRRSRIVTRIKRT